MNYKCTNITYYEKGNIDHWICEKNNMLQNVKNIVKARNAKADKFSLHRNLSISCFIDE